MRIHALALKQMFKRQVFFRRVLDGKAVEPGASAELPEGEVTLSIKAEPLRYEFFYQSGNGSAKSLGTALTKDLSTEVMSAQKNVPMTFTGIVIGLYATGNGQRCTTPADFDLFEYQEEQP